MKIRRKDIVFAKGISCKNGSIMRGERPYIVLSNESNNRFSSIVNVIPLTSNTSEKKKKFPTHITIEGFGLETQSIVLTEQITSIDKIQIIRKIGYVYDEAVMEKIEKKLEQQLALNRRAS